MENDLGRRNTQEAYNTVKALTKPRSGSKSTIKYKTGRQLSEIAQVMGKWKEYCEELYNHNIQVEQGVIEELKGQTASDRDKEPSILKSEVKSAIAVMSNAKSPGQDNIAGSC